MAVSENTLRKLGIEAVEETRPTGAPPNIGARPRQAGGVSDATLRKLDLQDTPIANQNEAGVFDGSTYEDGAGWNETNTEVYNSVGEETLGGLGPRLQQTTNDQGDKRTYFVPPPTNSKGPIDNFTESAARTVVGGGLEAAKGTAGFAEWAVDELSKSGVPIVGPAAQGITSVLGLADQLLGTQFSDTDKNWIDENFPTLPPQNDAEKMGQEIVSVVLGTIGGGGAAGTAGKGLTSVGKKIAELGTDFFNRAKQVDMANAAQKTQVFISELSKELFGMNVGATIATPTDVDSISGNLLPDALPGMSEDETNKVGHLIDNTAISGVFSLLGLATKPVVGAAKAFLGGKATGLASKDLEAQTAIDMLKQVDPGLADVSPEEFKRRSIMFSDMITENSQADVGQLGTFIRGPVTSTIKGADKYVENAYGYLKRTMPAEQWDAFKKSHAALITDNIVALRRDNMSNTIVQSADSRINDQANSIMHKAADDLGGLTSTARAGAVLGDQALSEVKSATDMVNLPNQNAQIAQGQLEAAQSQGTITAALENARKTNVLGGTPEEQAFLNNLTGPQLFQEFSNSKRAYDDAFKALPEGIGFDKARLAQLIVDSGNAKTWTDRLHLKGVGNVVEGGLDVNDVLAGLNDVDLADLYRDGRSSVSKVINGANGPGAPLGAEDAGAIAIKQFIDEAAANSGNDAFAKAMDLYIDHQNRFGQIDSLLEYGTGAKSVLQSKGIGADQLYMDARRSFDAALGTTDQTGLELANWTKALYGVDPQNIPPELGDVILSSALKRIGSSMDKVSSDAVAQAIQPFLPALRQLNPDAVTAYETAVTTLRTAERGSEIAKQAVAEAQAASKLALASAQKRAAFKFLEDFGDGLQVMPTGDLTTQFNQIFKTEGATRDLMNQARLSDDPMVLDGVKSQYLAYLKDRMFTNVPIAADGLGGAVPGSSGTNLGKMLEGSDLASMGVLNEVFKDDPKFADDLLMLMEEVRLDHTSRSIKPQTFSSNTGVDNTRRQALNTLITLTLGTLNRTAATARNLVNNITGVQADAQKEQVEKILATLLVDSTTLTQTLDSLGERPTRSQIEDFAKSLAIMVNTGAGGGAVRGGSTSMGDRIFNREDEGAGPEAQRTPDLTNQAFGLDKPALSITVDGANPDPNARY